jgi:hypothetical protein
VLSRTPADRAIPTGGIDLADPETAPRQTVNA